MRATLEICPGDGVVARIGTLVVVAVPDRPEQVVFVGELLTVADAVGDRPEAAQPVAALARRLVGLMALTEPADVPGFCVLSETADALAVLLHGDLVVRYGDGRGQPVQLDARGSLTWLDHVIRPVPSEVGVVEANAEVVNADPLTDLRAGVVRGGGVLLRTVLPDHESAGPITAHPSRPHDTGTTFVPPGETSAAPVVPDVAGSALARWSSVWSTDLPVRRRVGRLTTDDGTSYPLDRDYVVGRKPDGDEAVRGGSATPLVVDDAEHQVSRVHARVTVRATGVYVTDAGSANGTFWSAPGGDWALVPGDEPRQLADGYQILVGDRILVAHLPAR